MSRKLISILGVLTVAGVLAWAASSSPLQSTGSAHARPGTGYGYGGKVVICHRTHSKKHPFVTIVVSQNAAPAHLAHGDTLGPCPSTRKAGKARAGGSKHHSHSKRAGKSHRGHADAAKRHK